MGNASRAMVRFAALAPVLPIVGIGLIWLFWVFAYFSIPLFFPFTAYAETCSPIGIRGAPTIFHDRAGLYWSAAYLGLIVATTTLVTLHRSYVISLVALIPITVVFSAATHLVLYLAGFCYWLDSP
jgi:hypothetical protein